MYKLYIFDLDGTLLDTAPGIIASANFAAKKIGVDPLAENKFDGVIGTPIFDIYRQYYHLNEDKATEAVKEFRLDYEKHGLQVGTVYPGIQNLLTELKKINRKLAVATMKPRDTAEKMLIKFGLSQFFDEVLGRGDNPSTTKAHMILACMKKFSVDADETVMIGDSQHDQKGALDAGVDFIGVSYGYGFQNSNAKDVNELSSLLLQ